MTKKNQAEEIAQAVEAMEAQAVQEGQEVQGSGEDQEKEKEQERELTFTERVCALQNELKAPKSRYNSFGKYAYRSCEDILEAVKPLLKKYGLMLNISDEVIYFGSGEKGRFYVKAIADITDRERNHYLTSEGWAREEETKKGMDGSQITGTASSYARKYALNGLLLIDDTKDPDTDEYAKQTGKKVDYMAEISKFRNIADLELWWNKNLDDLKKQENYKEIFACASQKGKELNAKEGQI